MRIIKNKFKYAKFAVYGLNKEQVLFKLKNNVCFFDIEKTDDTLKFCVNKKDYKKVLLFLKRRKARYKVLKKFGFVCILKYALKNAGIILGIAFWAIFYLVFSANHFSIKIVSSNLNSEQTAHATAIIKEEIESDKTKTNREYERAILTKLNYLSGITIKKNGLFYEVSLYKRTAEDQQTEIIAPFNLKIKEVVVASGECLIKAGDVVLKGSILARAKNDNGKMEPPKILLKAHAYEIGSSYFNVNAPVLSRTGKSYKESMLSVFGFNLGKQLAAKYKYYDVIKEKTCVSESNFLPIYKTTYTYYEKDFIILENNQPNIESLKQKAKQEALKNIKNYASTYDESYTTMEEDGTIIVKCYLKFEYEIS